MNLFKALLLNGIILSSSAPIIANEPPLQSPRHRNGRERYLHATREQLMRELQASIPSEAALQTALNNIVILEKNREPEQESPDALK